MGLQENPDIFVKNCLSQRPYSDQEVATELAWHSIASYGVLGGDSLRPHGALTGLSRRFHCTTTVLTAHAPCSQCTPSLGALCDPTKSTGDASALLRRCLRSFCAHLGVLHFSRMPWDHHSGVTGV